MYDPASGQVFVTDEEMAALKVHCVKVSEAFAEFGRAILGALEPIARFAAALALMPELKTPVNSNPGMTRRRKRELIARLRR